MTKATKELLTQRCAIIGDPIEHSLSPLLHNTGYAALGIDFEYEKIRLLPAQLECFVHTIHDQPWRGVSVTIPHKVAILPYLDKIDAVAARIGAVNTVVNSHGELTGYNTDWFGAFKQVEPLLPAGQRTTALVLGAGGAARGVIYALQRCCAEVWVSNRTRSKAERLAAEFAIQLVNWNEIPGRLEDIQLIFNTTPLGMGELSGETPITKQFLTRAHIICDAVYAPFKTRLIREAEEVGCRTGLGYQMLLWQGIRQFELFTGQKAPVEAMTQALLGHLASTL